MKQHTRREWIGLSLVSLALLAGLIWGLFISSAPVERVQLQDLGPAPQLSLGGLDGTPISLDALRGSVVLVDFWGTWCQSCVEEMPGFEAVYRRYQERGFTILAVAVEFDRTAEQRQAKVQAKVNELGVTFPVVMGDDPSVEAFGGKVENFPQAYLIDRQGTVRQAVVGARPEAFWDRLVRTLLEEEE